MFDIDFLDVINLLQIRLAIVCALGPMSHLMAKDKLEEQAQRLLQGITGLYKKNQEHHRITQVLNGIY